ncbi:MAG TPA: DNA-directed RNA polymerase subunit alpha [Anaerolineales bacterium]|nr:DNA-directed RNA polymerase subunit alpha [Anaerolineae bacterium]HIQ01782.1 DNA-directed RNA polymerase subunit alpha [Anaerolineales bacterium]
MFTPVLPKIETEAISQQYGRFIIGPLESGYGITLGNALRRVLLSSLPGAAVTSIRILDVPHEFAVLPHVREDVTQIILQVKQLRLKMNGDGPMRMMLEARGEGVITAGDIKAPPEIELLNPDLYLFTTDSAEARVEMEFTVERGRGYSPAEERGRVPIGELPVDAIFSPIRRVAFDVERARVGQMTNYDRLTMNVWTDGRISPMEALKEAARILVTHLRLVAGITEEAEVEVEEEVGIPSRVYDVLIDDLGLSVRVFNALKRAGISKIGEVLDMLAKGEDAILTIRNFGDKSLAELKEKLQEGGYLEYLEAEEESPAG